MMLMSYFPSDSLPDSDPTLQEDLAMHVQGVLRRSSKSTIRPDEVQVDDPEPSIRTMPVTPSDDLSFLVEIRQRHQTKEAEKGVRLASTGTKSSSNTSKEQLSERRLLAQKIRDIVKEVDDSDNKEHIGLSTGLNRQMRWTKTPGLYSPSLALSKNPKQKSGNSANASEVAQTAGNLVSFSTCSRRCTLNGT